MKLKAILLASLLVSPALFSAPAFACGSSSEHYQAPVPTKPVIAFESLTADQLMALDTYAAALKQAVTDGKDALKAPISDDTAREQRWKDASAKFRAAAERAGDAVPFRTTITVGNGMLCGASIEVQVPPAPDNADYGVDTINTYGKDRAGKRARGLIYGAYLAETFNDLKKKSAGK